MLKRTKMAEGEEDYVIEESVSKGYPAACITQDLELIDCYLCSVCLDISFRRWSCKQCRKNYCQSCLEMCQDVGGNENCPTCRSSKGYVKCDDGPILALECRCINKQCPWTGTLALYRWHTLECSFSRVEGLTASGELIKTASPNIRVCPEPLPTRAVLERFPEPEFPTAKELGEGDSDDSDTNKSEGKEGENANNNSKLSKFYYSQQEVSTLVCGNKQVLDSANAKEKFSGMVYTAVPDLSKTSSRTLQRPKKRTKEDNDPSFLQGACRTLDFMYSAWQDQKFCDLVIKARGGDIKVHSVAFGAYSEAFTSSFYGCTNGEIIKLDLLKFNREVVLTIIRFLYTTELDFNDQIIGQVLSCATNLGMDLIMHMCMEYLSHVDVENTVLHYSIAENNNMIELRDEIMRYLLANFSGVSCSKHFIYLPLERLMFILRNPNLYVDNEVDVFRAVVRWLDLDRTSRIKYSEDLLQCVRFHLMTVEVLVSEMETADSIFINQELWRDCLDKAIKGGRFGGGSSGVGGFGGSDDTKKNKKVVTYIPPPPPEDQEHIFETMPKGIDFNKYDQIQVECTGSNKPPHDVNCFAEVDIEECFKENVRRAKYDKPTPIQKWALPIILAKRDLMACAQTGSGKTAAFLLPVLSMMLRNGIEGSMLSEVQEPQAIIVGPTRELVSHIFAEARKFSFGTIVRPVVVYEGVATEHQLREVEQGAHMVIGTPGRLLDFIRRGKVSLRKVKFLILSEADRMLDMGFMPDIKALTTQFSMPASGERQTLMFSATFAGDVQRLARELLNDYIFVTVGRVGGANTDIEQTVIEVGQFDKRQKLIDLIGLNPTDRVLVFVEQKRNADFLASFLCQSELPTTTIHGDREQREREIALLDFKSGRKPVLVATSVAARGLDIPGVMHVVNYDMPKDIDEYVHRIGRTGRCGNLGKATTFFNPETDSEIGRSLVKILTDAQQEIPDFLERIAGGSSGTGGFVGIGASRDDQFNGGFDGHGDVSVLATSGGGGGGDEAWD